MDEHNAKMELLRLNSFLEERVLLIGGLAVRHYFPGRSSKDLDLVCSLDQQKKLQATAYPTAEYENEEHQTDLRPELVYKNLKTGSLIYLGPKIIERPPYDFIDYSYFYENSVPFPYDGKLANNIQVPAAYVLAYSKLLSFISRRDGPKGIKDLDDFSNLTNHQSFSLNRFIAFVERLGATDHIRNFFLHHKLSEDEAEILRSCSPVDNANIRKYLTFFTDQL